MHGLIGQTGDVGMEVWTLRRHGLHEGVLVLHPARHQRQVDVPQCRHPAAGRAEQQALCRRRAVDQVFRRTEVFGNQFALGLADRLQQVSGQKAVLGHHRRGQCQFGGAAADQVEVGGFLRAVGEQLEKTGVIDAVKIIVGTVHIERGMGDGAATHIQHIGQALAGGGVQRLVHEGDTLRRREIGRPQTGHRQTGGDCRCRVFGFRLDKDQRSAGDIDMAVRRLLGPVLPHLRRWRDRVGAGGVGCLALAQDHRGIAIHGHAFARISVADFFCRLFSLDAKHD